MIDLLRGYFTEQSVDLAPWAGSAPGAFLVRGSPEAIAALRKLLS
jgi:hypothetical protein